MRNKVLCIAWIVVILSIMTFAGTLECDPNPNAAIYIIWIGLIAIFMALIMTADAAIKETKRLKNQLLIEQLSFYEPVNRPKQTIQELDALNTYKRKD